MSHFKDRVSTTTNRSLIRALQRVSLTLQAIVDQNMMEKLANAAQDQQKVSDCVEDIRDALTDYQVRTFRTIQQDAHSCSIGSLTTGSAQNAASTSGESLLL